jgi:hypothetical protein
MSRLDAIRLSNNRIRVDEISGARFFRALLAGIVSLHHGLGLVDSIGVDSGLSRDRARAARHSVEQHVRFVES